MILVAVVKQNRARKINEELKKLFPNANIVLNYSNNWELLVAVILSAQCTDVMVNKVTQDLFQKYKTLDDYVHASASQRTREKFERDIKSTGFFRNKTKNILAVAKIIKEKHDGKIPNTMEEMLSLPGVARKTANVVLGNAYGIVEGIAVDTHVKRLSLAFGLTKHTNPDKIEQDLMELLVQKEWFHFTYRMIEYGRKYYPAHKLKSKDHPLGKYVLFLI